MNNQFERFMEITVFESLAEDVACVLTSTPFPPGSRISFVAAEVLLHGKVVAILKRSEGLFAVNARLNSVSKAERAALVQFLT